MRTNRSYVRVDNRDAAWLRCFSEIVFGRFRTMRLAIDTGGTFTDLAVQPASGGLELFKAATTPQDPVEGVFDVLAVAAEASQVPLVEFLGKAEVLVHGTTRALNAVLTGNVAKTAFLTTQGHRDIL